MSKKITIVGTGYVGIVAAATFAEYGHTVTCLDVLKEKIDLLNDGECPIFEPNLLQLLTKNKERLTYTLDDEIAYKNSEIIFIAVGTPEREDGSANLKYVYDTVNSISKYRKSAFIVMKSTVPIGTNDKLVEYGKSLGADFDLISNPEFLSQGTAVDDMLRPARIVIGTETSVARDIMEELYSPWNCPKVFTNRRSAEMVKYTANDFLALKISYVNEIANLCEKLGANVLDVMQGIGYDDRIGSKFLNPGCGYGGSCFPKDTKALHWLAGFNDCELKTVKAAIDVNENQKLVLIKKARNYFDTFLGLNVAILGLTFKPNTDDLREAPSLINIRLLTDEGANIKIFDPIATELVKSKFPNVAICKTPEDALKNADICFIFTEWAEIKAIPTDVFDVMNQKYVFDGRNCFDMKTMQNKGIHYFGVGVVSAYG
ncbi:UDP-glucose 6-dehydrogenase [Clostridia bacterium]|nr:UDP-glucose 6-dehydrogenase [Clostridia bacterium]